MTAFTFAGASYLDPDQSIHDNIKFRTGICFSESGVIATAKILIEFSDLDPGLLVLFDATDEILSRVVKRKEEL